jgi:acetyl esterase/lipase
MPSVGGLLRFFKKLFIVILFVAIAIPLRYGSTNNHYLRFRLLHSFLSLKHSLTQDGARPTLSADYRAFEDIVRMKPLLEINGFEDPLLVIRRIRASSSMRTVVPKPSRCQINKEIFEFDGHTVNTYYIDNHQREVQRNNDRILIYFHGGGYMIGDIHSKLFSIVNEKMIISFDRLWWI